MTTAPADMQDLLRTCRKLFLRRHEVWVQIGVHDFEKRAEQRVVINVDLYVPLALSTGAGAESRQQIGWVLVGGLLLGTLLTLFVVPVAYTLIAGKKGGQDKQLELIDKPEATV